MVFKQAPGKLPTEPGYFFVRNHLKNRNGGRDVAHFTSAGWTIGTFTLELSHELEWGDESEMTFSQQDLEDAISLGETLANAKEELKTEALNNFLHKILG